MPCVDVGDILYVKLFVHMVLIYQYNSHGSDTNINIHQDFSIEGTHVIWKLDIAINEHDHFLNVQVRLHNYYVT